MAAKQHTEAGAAYRRGRVSPLLRAVSAALAGLWLTAPFAPAMGTTSLVRQNQLSAPYPSSYSKQTLARYARKPAAAPGLVKAAAHAPAKPSALELATQAKVDPAIYEQMEQTPPREPEPALVEAIIGGGHPTGPHTKVKLGYGKVIADNSNTVGMKNGTRPQEPGCFYVKTSVNF